MRRVLVNVGRSRVAYLFNVAFSKLTFLYPIVASVFKIHQNFSCSKTKNLSGLFVFRYLSFKISPPTHLHIMLMHLVHFCKYCNIRMDLRQVEISKCVAIITGKRKVFM